MTAGRIVVLGDVMNDVVVVPHGDIAPDTDTESQVRFRAGGSAANTAAWLGEAGAAVDFVGAVGADDAERHERLLRACGVVPHLQVEPDLPTGAIVILVRGEERTMLTERGANAALRPESLGDELLAGAAALHVSGYTILKDDGRGAATSAIARALAAGVPVTVSPGSAGYLGEYGAGRFLDAVAGAEVVFPNLAEGRLLAGRDDPDAVGATLLERFPIVVLTMGGAGAVLFRRGVPALQVPAAPAPGFADPTGAGDAFTAGFLARWVRDRDAEAATREATALAARAVGVLGARPGEPPLDRPPAGGSSPG